MKRGEVWWMSPPGEKARPACVLTRDVGLPILQGILVAPATTRVRAIASEVQLDEADGMPRTCVLSFDNLRTVDKRLLRERITTLSPARMQEAREALAFAAGCRF